MDLPTTIILKTNISLKEIYPDVGHLTLSRFGDDLTLLFLQAGSYLLHPCLWACAEWFLHTTCQMASSLSHHDLSHANRVKWIRWIYGGQRSPGFIDFEKALEDIGNNLCGGGGRISIISGKKEEWFQEEEKKELKSNSLQYVISQDSLIYGGENEKSPTE